MSDTVPSLTKQSCHAGSALVIFLRAPLGFFLSSIRLLWKYMYVCRLILLYSVELMRIVTEEILTATASNGESPAFQ
ncbi:hypothetical protein BDW22DRAFT_1364463 [Trametopsis cervina]|nr:hypothetical protein BDW22DRAFT_1364463 [Trametopsis cervina]